MFSSVLFRFIFSILFSFPILPFSISFPRKIWLWKWLRLFSDHFRPISSLPVFRIGNLSKQKVSESMKNIRAEQPREQRSPRSAAPSGPCLTYSKAAPGQKPPPPRAPHEDAGDWSPGPTLSTKKY